MITRTWHGRTQLSDADHYFQYLTETGVADLRKTKGNISVQIHRKTEGGITHFWVASVWDSLESIKNFAGEDFEKARYYAQDSHYLLELEPTVTHRETTVFRPSTTMAALTRQFEQLYDGELWLDETIRKKLADVDAANSVVQPLPALHNLQQVVLHIISWRKVLIARLQKDYTFQVEVNSPEDWKPSEELRAEDWEHILSELESTQQQIINLLQVQDESILDTNVGPFDYTYQYLIEGLIHHDLYHLGQLGIIKKLVRAQSD